MPFADQALESEVTLCSNAPGDALGQEHEQSMDRIQPRPAAGHFVRQKCVEVPRTPATMELSQTQRLMKKTKSKDSPSTGGKKSYETRVRNAALVKQYEEQIKTLQSQIRERDAEGVNRNETQDKVEHERIVFLEHEIVQLREAYEDRFASAVSEQGLLQERIDKLASDLLKEQEYSAKLIAQLENQQTTKEAVAVEEKSDIYCQYPLDPPLDENQVDPLRWRLEAIRHLWNRQAQLSDIKTSVSGTLQQTITKHLKLKDAYDRQRKALTVAEGNVAVFDQYENDVKSRLTELIELPVPPESHSMDIRSPDSTGAHSNGLLPRRSDVRNEDIEMDDDRS